MSAAAAASKIARRRLSREERFAWCLIAILFGGSIVNYIDRTVLGVVMPRGGHPEDATA